MGTLSFGIGISTAAGPGQSPVAAARAAEELGFDFVSASDHPAGAHPTYETWTLLTWVAAATSRIRVATRVLGVPFRSPAMVAKMAESLDRLSGGRLILGLGAGASDREITAFGGRPAGSGREKVDGLEEAVHVIRGLWSEPELTYRGHFHQTDAAELQPKPLHQIPVWLGTFGDRALAVTGRHADGWIPSLGYAPAERLPAMRDRVMAAARAAGRAPGEVTCALNVEVHTGSRRGTGELGPDVVSGTAEEVAATLHRFVAMGFSAFNFLPVGAPAELQAHKIATEVIPALLALLPA